MLVVYYFSKIYFVPGTNIKFQFQIDVLSAYKGKDEFETARKVMRRVFSKDLMVQFSLTGLGHCRKRTKISFKDHASSSFIFGMWFLKLL